jgi:hypothetical protein
MALAVPPLFSACVAERSTSKVMLTDDCSGPAYWRMVRVQLTAQEGFSAPTSHPAFTQSRLADRQLARTRFRRRFYSMQSIPYREGTVKARPTDQGYAPGDQRFLHLPLLTLRSYRQQFRFHLQQSHRRAPSACQEEPSARR